MLPWLVVVPFLGAILSWLAERLGDRWSRWTALLALAVELILGLLLLARHPFPAPAPDGGAWISVFDRSWIPALGIRFHLAADGISLLLVLLTAFLGIAAVAASWDEIRERVGFFHANLMGIVAGIVGVFLAMDLFLFYVFWEVMLIPMYFLIAVWGHENRAYASIKFFLFTQAGSLLMLVSILALYFIHHRHTGVYTFGYPDLLGTPLGPRESLWLMLGFFAAFAVKLPAVPLHTWLPDAHTEAPTGGSVILAGLLLKTGAYGLLRFAVPLFPSAAREFAPVAIWLGAAGVLYGAVLAFAQTDFKRLVAYTSVSHLGFVLMGIYSWNETALQGAVMEMLCHGLSTGALFLLAGSLQERLHTRDMGRMGGLWSSAPRMGGMTLFFALASLGLPGLGNFIGEFLILAGSWRVNGPATAAATAGLVAAAVYALAVVQRVFHGPERDRRVPVDLSGREMGVLAAMIVLLVWLGLYPQPVFDTVLPALSSLQRHTAGVTALLGEVGP